MNPFDRNCQKGKTPPKKTIKSPKTPSSIRKRKRGQTLSGEAKKHRKVSSEIKRLPQADMSHLKGKAHATSSSTQSKAGTSKSNSTTVHTVSRYFNKQPSSNTTKETDLTERVAPHTDTQSAAIAPHTDTQSTSTAIEGIMKKLEEMTTNENTVKNDLTILVHTVDSRLESIQKNVERTEKKLNSIEQKMDNTEKKIDRAEKKIDETMKTIDNFRLSLEFTQGEVQDLKEEFKTVKEKFKSIETNHTNISQTNIALSTQIQQMQKEKENCSAKFDDLENYSRRENVICLFKVSYTTFTLCDIGYCQCHAYRAYHV